MQLSDLNEDEEVALIGLLREVIQADGVFSDIEREEVDRIRKAIGSHRFDEATAEFAQRFGKQDDFREFLSTIERQDARELIFETLTEVAASDDLDITEERPLLWLASWWGIQD